MIMWQENLGGFTFGPEQVIATGTPSTTADSLLLEASAMVPGQFMIFFQGDAALLLPQLS
ncbi:MAG: hypothetical protein QF903_13475 [Planctomycetota bacterium]|nr:hypothetical protein [Planctomycetota bacterium]MDP6762570.1 hypothetical protein [Planctomycetota bacterium]MDP6990474.1 hypothetical protein [Planctomycetota bacterium]